MRVNLYSTYQKISSFILKCIIILTGTIVSISTLLSIVLNARPVADDYGHIAYISTIGVIDYARGFFTGVDSHPLSVMTSSLVNFLLSSIGLIPGFALLVTVQIVIFLVLSTLLISSSVKLNRRRNSNLMLFSISILLLILTLNFAGSTTQSPYRAYALVGWVNFFWQHVPLNLLQVFLFLRWRKNLWLERDTTSLVLVFILAIWGPLEGITTLGMFLFITMLQFKNMKFSMFKTNNLEFYFSFFILLSASLFTFFSPSATSRRLQYSKEVRIGHWYERFLAYNLLSFREIVVFGIFAALLSGLIGFIFGFKQLLSTNKLSFWNLIISLICLVLGINFVETFSYFAPFHHTVFSFVFVLSVFIGGVELGMKTHRTSLWIQPISIFVLLISVVSFYSPASVKAFNYRQNWDSTQTLILSKCTNGVDIPGISVFLPGSSMNPDWNIWSCKNRSWFEGISSSTGEAKNVNSNRSARVLNLGFNKFLNLILDLFFGGLTAGSKIIEKFNYYSY